MSSGRVRRRVTDRRTVAWRPPTAPGEGPSEVCHVPTTSSSAAPTATSAAVRLPAWWAWGVGGLLGLVVVGPGLQLGPLLSFDLQITPWIPFPPGALGLGPGLSQRVPLFVLLAGLSAVVGGPAAGVAFLVGCTAAAFAGTIRLCRLAVGPEAASQPLGLIASCAAGLLWAAGPFALTRIGAGHLNLVWAVAVLPWVLPRLARPGDHPPSTFLAALLLAVGGPAGGTLGLVASGVVLLVAGREARRARAVVAAFVPHVVWVAPTVVLLWAGAGVQGAGDFATQLGGALGWPGIAVGTGFWRADLAAGAGGLAAGAVGIVVLVLATVGARSTWSDPQVPRWQRTTTVVAVVGLALAVASGTPGVRSLYGWVSDLPVGAPLRESQRFVALWLVWALPLAVRGALDLGRASTSGRDGTDGRRPAVPAAVPVVVLAVASLVASVPGWWGIGGRLEPVAIPPSWDEAAEVIDAAPGPVLALPWAQHPVLPFADDRQAFNPLPPVLGGDVLSSYDPLFDRTRPSQEQVDGRAARIDALVPRLRAGEPVSAELAELGVRWVVLAHIDAWRSYRGLAADPGLSLQLRAADLDLYEVVGWSGMAQAPGGSTWDLDRPLPPIIRTGAPAGSTLAVAGAPGWVRGWGGATSVRDDGRLVLETGRGPVWFWPAAVLVAVDAALVGGAIWCARSRHRLFGRILAAEVPRG